jgi:hypothetical protein
MREASLPLVPRKAYPETFWARRPYLQVGVRWQGPVNSLKVHADSAPLWSRAGFALDSCPTSWLDKETLHEEHSFVCYRRPRACLFGVLEFRTRDWTGRRGHHASQHRRLIWHGRNRGSECDQHRWRPHNGRRNGNRRKYVGRWCGANWRCLGRNGRRDQHAEQHRRRPRHGRCDWDGRSRVERRRGGNWRKRRR